MIAGATVENRAIASRGTSAAAIHRMVERALDRHGIAGGLAVDLGCGKGDLAAVLTGRFQEYAGVDAVRFDGFPPNGLFLRANLDAERAPLPDACATLVAAVETIEHLENPRAFVRELTRLAKPGGWVIVTTPNQTSLLSLATLALKGAYSAFQDTDYPAHITPLLELDLRRIFTECGLRDVSVDHTHRGRAPFTARHWPAWLSRRFPERLSDNLLAAGRKP